MEIRKIFSKKIAMQLIRNGNDLVDTEPNLKNNKFKVFIFEDTEKFKLDLSIITQK